MVDEDVNLQYFIKSTVDKINICALMKTNVLKELIQLRALVPNGTDAEMVHSLKTELEEWKAVKGQIEAGK